MSVRRITDAQRRARLGARHLLAPAARCDDAGAIADAVLALHATDPPTVHLSAWARMATPEPSAVEQRLADKTLVRHHAMRRTLWVAGVPTMALMHEAATRKIAANECRLLVRMLTDSGIDAPERWIADATAEVLALLRAEGPLNSRAIGKRLPRLNTGLRAGSGTKWEVAQSAHTRLLTLLGFEAVVTRTTPVGGWHTSEFAWLPTADWLGRELAGPPFAESAAELAGAWLRRFGPATAEDLQWWMGWTKTLTRDALAAAGAEPVELSEGPGWLAPDDHDFADPGPWVALLPTLDPTTMGWKHRRWYLPETAARDAFDRAGNASPTVWADGRVVGTWAQRADGQIRIHWFEEVPARRRHEITTRAEEVAGWIGETRFRVRFPSPLHKTLLTD